MDDKPEPKQPRLSPQAEADQARRLARQTEALRENLRRRKEQARAREADQGGTPPKP